MWEYYVHKLGAWDERSFEEFRGDVLSASYQSRKPTKEQQVATIDTSKSMLESFELSSEGGQE